MKILKLISPLLGSFVGGMVSALLGSMGIVFMGVIIGFFLPWLLIYMPEVQRIQEEGI
jgi:Flp pilus assembly protein TadB